MPEYLRVQTITVDTKLTSVFADVIVSLSFSIVCGFSLLIHRIVFVANDDHDSEHDNENFSEDDDDDESFSEDDEDDAASSGNDEDSDGGQSFSDDDDFNKKSSSVDDSEDEEKIKSSVDKKKSKILHAVCVFLCVVMQFAFYGRNDIAVR